MITRVQWLWHEKSRKYSKMFTREIPVGSAARSLALVEQKSLIKEYVRARRGFSCMGFRLPHPGGFPFVWRFRRAQTFTV